MAAAGQPTDEERYVLHQVAAGQSADLLEKFVLPVMTPEHRRLAREKGLTGYLDFLEASNLQEKQDFLQKYRKTLQMGAHFLEELLTGALATQRHHRGVMIKNAIISEPLDLKSAEVPCEVELINCEFQEDVNFQDSRFEKNLRMDGCRFAGEAHFLKMTVRKSAYFRGATFEGRANFNGIDLGDSLNMDHTRFRSLNPASFDSSKIDKSAYFLKAEFSGPVKFRRAYVGDELNFGALTERSIFNRGLDLTGSKIGSHFAMRGATIIGPVKFVGLKVGSDFYLEQAIIFGSSEFTGADIKGSLKAQKTWFLGPHYPMKPENNYAAIFPDMKVGHVANFEEAVFLREVNLSRVHVGLELRANNAKFYHQEKALDAIELKVGTIAYFEDADFLGPVNFAGADIGGIFNAAGAGFHSTAPAIFSGIKVGELAQFTEVEFRGPVLFSRAEVGGKLITKVEDEKKEGAIIRGAVFGGEVSGSELSFADAKITDLELQGTDRTPFYIHNLDLKRLRVDKDLSLESATVINLEAANLQVIGQASLKNTKITHKADFSYSSFGTLKIEMNINDWPPRHQERENIVESENKPLRYLVWVN